MSDNVMPAPAPFDMPDTSATFEARGGWVVNRLAGDLHLTINQAGGIVGNCGYESEGFKALQEIRPLAGRGGYGWPMWTGPRRRAFEAWCAEQDLDVASDRANYGYLLHELLTTPVGESTLKALRAESTLERCVFVVGRLYETPAGTTETNLPGYADRLRWAQRALAGAVGLSHVPAAPAPAVVEHHAAATASAGAPGQASATAKNNPPVTRTPTMHPAHAIGGMAVGAALTATLVWVLGIYSVPVPETVSAGWTLLFAIPSAIVLHKLPWLQSAVGE